MMYKTDFLFNFKDKMKNVEEFKDISVFQSKT